MNRNRFWIVLFCFVAVMLFLTGCKNKQKKDVGLEDAEYLLISMKTEGNISFDDKIEIRFREDMVSNSQLKVDLEEQPFFFEPNVKGKAYWDDRRTLIFEPEEDFKSWQNYEGFCDFTMLDIKGKLQGIEKTNLYFFVIGQRVNVQQEIKLVDEKYVDKIFYEIKVKFNFPTDLNTTKESISLTYKDSGEKVKFRIAEEQSGKNYTIITQEFTRSEFVKDLVLKIHGNKLNMEDHEELISIPNTQALDISVVNTFEDNYSRGINVKFLDKISTKEDYSGYFVVEPDVNFQVKFINDKAILSGDFKAGLEYQVTVKKGIRSVIFAELMNDQDFTVEFKDINPMIEFSQTGVFLPSSSLNKIHLKTVNLDKIYVTVKRIYPNNIIYFLQDYQLIGNKSNDDSYWNFNRVGDQIYTDTLVIGDTKNTWHQLELDLNEIIQKDSRGIFLVEAWTSKENMLVDAGRDYYYYYYRPLFVTKPVIVSNIGLITKKTEDGYVVFTNDLLSSNPLGGVKVTAYSYTNQKLAETTTGSDGKGTLSCENAFVITATKNDQVTISKTANDNLSTSLFDVGGLSRTKNGLKTFIYTDRGVYRPGDSIRVSLIVRNQNETFPDNHPVTCTFTNPRGQTHSTSTSKNSSKGFYTFHLKTDDLSPTGSWYAKFDIGGNKFNKEIKVETIAPYKLKVNLTPVKETLTEYDNRIEVNVESKYLFGNPAAGLTALTEFSLEQRDISFPKYPGFTFNDATAYLQKQYSEEFNRTLDDKGSSLFYWTDFDYSESVPMVCKVHTRVLEKGGRPVPAYAEIPVDIFDAYVGIAAPDGFYTMSGEKHTAKVIYTNKNGIPINGRTLHYKVYQGRRYWWYDYDRKEKYRRSFKSDVRTELVAEGTVVSGSTPVDFSFVPSGYGQLLVEVSDGENGHCASYFFNLRSWGYGSGSQDADVVNLRLDKEEYSPGDSAILIVDTPKEGNLLLSVEKGKKILYTKWYSLNGNSTRINIPVTSTMLPNAYAFVSIIQPHNQTSNDRPQRLYGIAPIKVVEQSTVLHFNVDLPKELRPEKDFEIEIQTKDNKPAQFTVAVVDEGLLDITRFNTPDPWNYFYQKEALGIVTGDMYNQVIGEIWGDIFKKYSIGGGYDDYLDQMGKKPKVRRFKPVALFEGPITTDSKGKAKVKFTMPNYVGSIRAMVIGARDNAYGNFEKAVPVKSELIILPEMPRVMGPEDKITIPATVFAMVENLGDIEVSVTIDGPIKVIGENKKTITLNKVTDKDVFFTLQAESKVDAAKLVFKAKSKNFESKSEIDIAVRPSNPPVQKLSNARIEEGESVELFVSNDGIEGTNRAELSLSSFEKLNFGERLSWLIHYPYGCIEQTTSSVFPQLYLSDVSEVNTKQKHKIDENINSGINRLKRFQLSSGAMSYWPGGNSPCEWGSIYAAHFLYEAENKGYHVPKNMKKYLISYLQKSARAAEGNFFNRIYRLYVLSLYNQPNMGAMNLLKQNSYDALRPPEQLMLAACYQNAGNEKIAKEMIKDIPWDIKDYKYDRYTYGSSTRDRAIMLEMYRRMGNLDKADKVYQLLTDRINAEKWHSTQTLSWALVSMGKYVTSFDSKDRITGEVTLPNGEESKFDLNKPIVTIPITEGFGNNVKIKLNSGRICFAKLLWEGVPLRAGVETSGNNMSLVRTFLNDTGSPINISDIKQGTDFWVKLTVSSEHDLDNVALVFMIPAGWEIENTRLSGEQSKFAANQSGYDYLDIRDDKAMWFFDMNHRSSRTYYLKLNAVTAGEFYLPPTILEAMYDDDYYYNVSGQEVKVTR